MIAPKFYSLDSQTLNHIVPNLSSTEGNPTTMHNSRNNRAVSHIIAATMLITVAMAIAFITYLFAMNYVGATTTKSGKAIEIQTMNLTNEHLTVYVQNIGQETATLDPANCIYTNGELKHATINKTTLPKGETATITVNSFTNQPNNLKIKITTTDGTTTEATLQ
jgi:FlaG/FlaF family flagellin (archaellin)